MRGGEGEAEGTEGEGSEGEGGEGLKAKAAEAKAELKVRAVEAVNMAVKAMDVTAAMVEAEVEAINEEL